MWKHLEKHRHRYGLILFGLGLVWLVAGFLPWNDALLPAHLRQLAIFAAIVAISAFYYASGVPGLIEALTITSLAAVCLGIALLPHLLPLRGFALTPDFAYATAGILFFLLVFLLQTPRKARAWARRLVMPESPAARRHECQLEAAEAQTEKPDRPAADAPGPCPHTVDGPPAAAGPDAPDSRAETVLAEADAACRPAATPYRQVSQYKQALLDSFRSWSLANALPAMRWVRAMLALVLIIGGAVCIAMAMGMESEAGTGFLRSNRFALLFAGVAALFYAFGVIVLGLLRGLALPGFAVLTFYSALAVIRIEGVLANRPLALRAAVIVLFLVLYGLLLRMLFKGFQQRHDLFNWVYQMGPSVIGVDIALKDLLPIADYTERIDAVLALDESLEGDRLRQKATDTAAWYQHRLNVRKILPVGFVFDPDARRLTMHAYCRTDHAADAAGFCERILSLQGMAAAVRHEADPDWRVYRERLFPDPVTLHEIINVQQLDLLDREGVDLQAVHPVRIELRFPDCERRAAAQARLAAAGYEAVADDSLDSRERTEFENTPDFCLAFIELNTRLGLERINTITGTLICLIQPDDGDLFGWELIAPSDAERFEEP